MGRDIELRTNYRADSTYLLRLLGSVEKDSRFSVPQKRDIMRALRYVATAFMEITTPIEEGE